MRSPEAQQVAELAVALADGDRLARGRRYQRKGNVSGVLVASGVATAEVQGSRAEAYDVTVAVRPANENVRRAVTQGDLAAAVPRVNEVAVTCVCPDWGDPCKHGVAAILQLGAEIDDDPRLLLRWRGIDEIVPPPPPGSEPLDRPSRAVASFDPDVPDSGESWGSRRRRPGRPSGSAGDESLGHGSGDVVGDRLSAVRRLRERMGDRLVHDASDLVDPLQKQGDSPDEHEGALHGFFVGAMPADASPPVERLHEVQLDVYRSLGIMIEAVDAAPVMADAIDTIAEHWLGR